MLFLDAPIRRSKMTTAKVVVRSIVKGLKILTKEVEKMEKLLDEIEKDTSTKRTKTKPPKKPGPRKTTAKKKPIKKTAVEQVVAAIGRSKKGVTTEQIRERTGFNEKKIWDAVNRAKKQGKVKSVRRGVYART